MTPAGKRRVRPPLYEPNTPVARTTHCTPNQPLYDSKQPPMTVDACTSPIKLMYDENIDPERNIHAGKLQSFAESLSILPDGTITTKQRLSRTKKAKNDDDKIGYWFNDVINSSVSTLKKSLNSSVTSSAKSSVSSYKKITETTHFCIEMPPRKIVDPKVSQSKTKLLPTAINFGNRSKMHIGFVNKSERSCSWKIVPIGKPHLNIESVIHLLDDGIFRFEKLDGRIDSQSNMSIFVRFVPLSHGYYSQTFQVRVNGNVLTLKLEGAHSNSPKLYHTGAKFSNPRQPTTKANIFQKLPKVLTLEDVDKETLLAKIICSQNCGILKPEIKRPLWLTLFERPPTPEGPDVDLPSDLKTRGLSINICDLEKKNSFCQFGCVHLGSHKTMTVKLCNSNSFPITVHLTVLDPFVVPVKTLVIAAKSFVPFPIRFYPERSGSFDGLVKISQKQTSDISNIILAGKCVH